MGLPAIDATVDEARYQARKHGRPFILAADLRSALLDYQIPSDEAMRHVFQYVEERPAVRSAARPDSRVNSILQRRRSAVA